MADANTAAPSSDSAKGIWPSARQSNSGITPAGGLFALYICHPLPGQKPIKHGAYCCPALIACAALLKYCLFMVVAIGGRLASTGQKKSIGKSFRLCFCSGEQAGFRPPACLLFQSWAMLFCQELQDIIKNFYGVAALVHVVLNGAEIGQGVCARRHVE